MDEDGRRIADTIIVIPRRSIHRERRALDPAF